MATEPKPITYTEHAEERIAKRGISRNQVSSTIRHPTSKVAGNTEYSQVCYREFHPNRLLVVVIEELPEEIKVITA